MTAPRAVVDLFGWRSNRAPNIADKDSPASHAVATAMFDALGVVRSSGEKPQTLGSRFERAVAGFVEAGLAGADRGFSVGRQQITEFEQYRHLERITELLDESDPGGTLRSEIGTDYLIKPDVTVGIRTAPGGAFLHAAISCKWSIRSDRVQNIRHEGVILGRHRRGRQPHVVTVTCEPLPSRLAAIARGTGEVDSVYHATFDELEAALDVLVATRRMDVSKERDTFRELAEQDRLRPLDVLPEVLRVF